MKIFTSYFANQSKLVSAGIIPIGIALYTPKWYKGLEYKKIAPKAFMLSGNLTQEEYIKYYNAYVLAKINHSEVIADLQRLTGGKDCALLCYEKPGDFCHRHLFSEFMRRKGYDIKEWEPKEEPKPQQMSLF